MIEFLAKFPYLYSLAVIGGTFLVFLVVRHLAIKLLSVASGKTQTKIDDILIQQIKLPSILWGFVIAIHVGLEFSDIPLKYQKFLIKVVYSILIISFTIFLANLLVSIIKHLFQLKKLPTTGTTLTFVIIQSIVYITGILLLLSYLGIPITPLITTLGIGGLAIGLALKDTLANIFSGLYILMEKRIDIGDFIEIDDKKRGYITDINWRTTIIKTISNDTIIIPNEKLAQSTVINYAKPVDYVRTSIEIPVSYETDTDKFESVVMEEVKQFISQDNSVLPEPEPVLRLEPGFSNNSLIYTLFVFCSDYNTTFYVRSELRKRILKRLRKERIEIPYSKLDLYVKELPG
ncbi:MAG: mechanosensitive ion channel family protein [Hydrogenothermaceae bacterium]|nr:mechanosensitive ion channel family protein [Hydrogenothermaceae bacterium]